MEKSQDPGYPDQFMTRFGIFKDNEFIDHDTGEVMPCVTYNMTNKEIEGKLAYLHFRKNTYGDWTVFQYVLAP